MHTASPPKDLAKFLLQETTSQGLSKAYFVNSGGDAVEAAIKLIVAFHRANGNPHRTHFVSRKRSFHGNTIAAICLSNNPGRKIPYEEAFNRLDVSFISPAYAYRHQGSDKTEAQYSTRLVNGVKAEFCRIGRQNVAAFVAETAGGSTAGCIEAPRGYFEGTTCGNGHTGTYFAFESKGAVHPDIMIMGKGLSGGYLPLAATLINQNVHETIERARGFIHGHTYQAHPAIEFIADKRLKMPLAKDFAFRTKLRQFAHESGVAILSGSGTADSRAGDHILLAPPLTIKPAELDWMIGAVRQAYVKTEEAYKKRRAFN
ncbi:hypothetical protein G3M48_000771 [Beauveria asiatica]|uniref:Aminotransferase n=1 Tax=Beauveria asiatica TaxID=1069075 RepID=A0AAW0RZV9_9HYPO